MFTATGTIEPPKLYDFDALPDGELRLLHAIVDTLLTTPGGRLLCEDQGSATAAHELVIGLLRQGDAVIVRTLHLGTQKPTLALRFTAQGYLVVSRPEGRA